MHLLCRMNIQTHDGQFDVVLLEAVDAREVCGGQKVAIHPQVREATRTRPVGQLGVDTLATRHQRCQQADMLATKIFEQLRRNTVRRLRLYRGSIVNAVLRAQLDVQQTQEVPHLGCGAHGALAPPA